MPPLSFPFFMVALKTKCGNTKVALLCCNLVTVQADLRELNFHV